MYNFAENRGVGAELIHAAR